MSHRPHHPRRDPNPVHAPAGPTLAAALRARLPGLSWTDARRLIAQRHVRVNGTVCLDDARRLDLADRIDIDERSAAGPAPQRLVRIVYRDNDIVVVEKAAGLQTVRRIEEAQWSAERKRRQPVLQEIVAELLKAPRVRAVHRLDRDTSGLMLFALSAPAETELVRKFKAHEIRRTYEAVVLGQIRSAQTIDTHLTRDRGDGLRGSSASSPPPPDAQRAITHIEPIKPLGASFTLIRCCLETGRTHQIRIHLSESGHMLAGEKVYARPHASAEETPDPSNAPRQALHSAELEFDHPITGKRLHFTSDWPGEMRKWMEGLN